MAKGLICMGVSAGASVARVGVWAVKTSLNVALLPPTLAVKVLTTIADEGNKLADKADAGLKDVGGKCGF